MSQPLSRRQLLQASTLTAASVLASPMFCNVCAQDTGVLKSPNERWRIGYIGMRYQGSVITREALPDGDVVAICDVDRHVREQARASFGSTAEIFEDYRDLLQRQNIDVVLIGTPDHRHSKMVIDACCAGKDVYCEKPLTLTIDEGKVLCRVVAETKRVVNQHRSASLCHLGNIALRIGGRLSWDPVAEQFVGAGAAAANPHLRREQRAGFEVA